MTHAQRVEAAFQIVSQELEAQRTEGGYWTGELSSSALSTATAVSALSLMRRHAAGTDPETIDRLIEGGLGWLAAHQNRDGGLGDTDRSQSNISTTMLGRAAIHLAEATGPYDRVLEGLTHYIDLQGGVPALKLRYGQDKTFAVPILTNCALAGLVDWKEVSPLPFEVACLPQSMFRLAQLPVVSYAIPALVAIGQARYLHRAPRNPIAGATRRAEIRRSL
jgi:squalene-hopene/tetraprenyl-beta-curcumene cyclase